MSYEFRNHLSCYSVMICIHCQLAIVFICYSELLVILLSTKKIQPQLLSQDCIFVRQFSSVFFKFHISFKLLCPSTFIAYFNRYPYGCILLSDHSYHLDTAHKWTLLQYKFPFLSSYDGKSCQSYLHSLAASKRLYSPWYYLITLLLLVS